MIEAQKLNCAIQPLNDINTVADPQKALELECQVEDLHGKH